MVDAFSTVDKHNPTFGLSDLFEDKTLWPNTHIAEYFNIKSIEAKSYD